MTNQEINIEICNHLLKWFSNPKNKDQRFHQGLYSLGITEQWLDLKVDGVFPIKDKHNESSKVTLTNLSLIINK